MNTEIILDLTT